MNFVDRILLFGATPRIEHPRGARLANIVFETQRLTSVRGWTKDGKPSYFGFVGDAVDYTDIVWAYQHVTYVNARAAEPALHVWDRNRKLHEFRRVGVGAFKSERLASQCALEVLRVLAPHAQFGYSQDERAWTERMFGAAHEQRALDRLLSSTPEPFMHNYSVDDLRAIVGFVVPKSLFGLAPGYCMRCGYCLKGNCSGRCSECGATFSRLWSREDMPA